jgi:hypothetical protein
MRDPNGLGQALLELASRHMPPDVLRFVTQGVPEAAKPFQRSLFFGYFAGVGRRTRDLSFELSDSERAQLIELGISEPDAWPLACALRVALLASACAALDPREHLGLLKEAYAKGDNGERIAVLRGLSLLPDARRFTDIAAEACRTHVQDVFEAVACDNEFPQRYFPDQSYNQLVIKALFVEIPLARVKGLRERRNPELYRMARDYEAERRAAGRPVSSDLAFVAHALENEP